MDQGPYRYSVVPGEESNVDHQEEKDHGGRQKILRSIGRRVRSMSSIPFCGRSGTLYWIISSTWLIFFFYALYGGGCIAFWYYTGRSVHEALDFPTRPSSLSASIQFLAAFLTGLTMTEAAGRYKAALAALLEFRDATESLRVSLCSSTPDPKLRVSVHLFISWMMCLFQKSIVFYTEDFSDSIRNLIPNEATQCVLFQPELLWKFDLVEFQYVFSSFMVNSQLWDHRDKTIEKLWIRMLHAHHTLNELLQVRSPTTKLTVGKIAVHFFLLSIPLVNGDFVSPIILPMVAAMFYAILQLSQELGDPWGMVGGQDLHELPLLQVMGFLALPMFAELDFPEIDATVRWLNTGLLTGAWTFGGENPIPRTKAIDPNKGCVIDFEAQRTLGEVAGFKTWDSFLMHQRQDMGAAERNGRRMPVYLKWNVVEPGFV